ncbi:hypothetical protein A3F00_05480 [Candidatus Daviesbacteria bacterium RIFCSPHIGHO2_12_FULL_37_11]|uniref:Excinuclease ABC subunit C n=1 Tax=Candidatus Daviesbacteria bacterium RIFCSPHIGHO2_12_FULL_37_11 TaxID=1797777 RepID=A0A1F5KD40_9BACT|nr:MAG: hypothetical protein A2111_00455 [Candidatus Daviesbacteria bacterium GWA1_38_6]OGE38501.1 MAG: hypothetical protein A3F00_05480 [Candidatus Daviesbacteria bacterium RIFCSPHIGHO2_12_FULL_37_11]
MIPVFINKSQIPHKPGVYQFKNKSGRIIYVGKAIDLYHRVLSYFHGYPLGVNVTHTRGVIASHLRNEIASVETIIVESELEALILEANLIKKYLPEFNVSLKDDKDYLYIKITEEDYPRVITARKNELKESLKNFGPFPSSRTVRDTLKALRKVFSWCSNAHPRGVNTNPPRGWNRRACFYYHLGLCPGACIGKITKADYRKNIFRLAKLLEGKKEKLVSELLSEMESVSRQQRFEDAAKVKKTLTGINYLTQTNRTSLYLENPNFLQDERQKALESLQEALQLPKLPERIECYDISNIQGHEATGSMVVLTEGDTDKSQYRKFKIKTTGKPNDVGMLREVISRRLKHKEWPFPDLIIVDGGIAQARAVSTELTAHRHPELVSGSNLEMPKLVRHDKMDIPVYGIAKRMEWLYSPDGSIIKLPKSHPASKLLQKLRDEAHRFAITYHRKLHLRSVIPSETRNLMTKSIDFSLRSKLHGKILDKPE